MNGRESAGNVDLVRIPPDTRKPTSEGLQRGDLLDLILIQMKGGSAAKPSPAEIARLQLVRREYRARNIALFEWWRKEFSRFSRLVGVEWMPKLIRDFWHATAFTLHLGLQVANGCCESDLRKEMPATL